jgi:hypothetical protein
MDRRFLGPLAVALAVTLGQTWGESAVPQPPAPQPPPPAANQPAKPQPASQVPDYGRPTKSTDPQPTFDFAKYFVGKWTFEWDVPTSPFGEGGLIEGTETFKAMDGDGRYFESEIKAKGPDGPFTTQAVMIYLKDAKVVSRVETDSRKFSLIKSGSVGGDLGGYYNIHYESAPFMVNGTSVRMRTTTHLFSPIRFNVRAQISVNGGPFRNFGNPWWKRVDPPAS